MMEQFVRTAMLLGEEGMERLARSRVAVFGLGGVGGHVVEALARSGVGALDLVDNDRVSLSNLNRQIIATRETIGLLKTQVMKERIASVWPGCKVTLYNCFYLPQEREQFPFEEYDYIVDAIDTVTAKIDLAVTAERIGIPIISSMGTGNKLDPCRLRVADIYDTKVCPLARVMRRELKAGGVRGLKVVYSEEQARTPCDIREEGMEELQNNLPWGSDARPVTGKRTVPGSTAFVPAVAGLIMAGEVVRYLAD